MKEENKEEIVLNDGYKTIEFKSLRGGLIQVVMSIHLAPFLFKKDINIDEFVLKLQSNLDLHLKFNTEVKIDINDNGQIQGVIVFETEDGIESHAFFHIIKTDHSFDNSELVK